MLKTPSRQIRNTKGVGDVEGFGGKDLSKRRAKGVRTSSPSSRNNDDSEFSESGMSRGSTSLSTHRRGRSRSRRTGGDEEVSKAPPSLMSSGAGSRQIVDSDIEDDALLLDTGSTPMNTQLSPSRKSRDHRTKGSSNPTTTLSSPSRKSRANRDSGESSARSKESPSGQTSSRSRRLENKQVARTRSEMPSAGVDARQGLVPRTRSMSPTGVSSSPRKGRRLKSSRTASSRLGDRLESKTKRLVKEPSLDGKSPKTLAEADQSVFSNTSKSEDEEDSSHDGTSVMQFDPSAGVSIKVDIAETASSMFGTVGDCDSEDDPDGGAFDMGRFMAPTQLATPAVPNPFGAFGGGFSDPFTTTDTEDEESDAGSKTTSRRRRGERGGKGRRAKMTESKSKSAPDVTENVPMTPRRRGRRNRATPTAGGDALSGAPPNLSQGESLGTKVAGGLDRPGSFDFTADFEGSGSPNRGFRKKTVSADDFKYLPPTPSKKQMSRKASMDMAAGVICALESDLECSPRSKKKGLVKSIGRYFGRSKRNMGDGESDHESVSSRSSRSSLMFGGGSKSGPTQHRLLDDEVSDDSDFF